MANRREAYYLTHDDLRPTDQSLNLMNYTTVQDRALVLLDVGRLQLLLGCSSGTLGRMDLPSRRKILKHPSLPDQYRPRTVSQKGCYSCVRHQG